MTSRRSPRRVAEVLADVFLLIVAVCAIVVGGLVLIVGADTFTGLVNVGAGIACMVLLLARSNVPEAFEVDVRIPYAQYDSRLKQELAGELVAARFDVPAVGAEVEIRLRINGRHEDAAERNAIRLLEHLGVTVLAVRPAR